MQFSVQLQSFQVIVRRIMGTSWQLASFLAQYGTASVNFFFRYTYLFKGLEDLHLDERITQFLEICNHMFAKEER